MLPFFKPRSSVELISDFLQAAEHRWIYRDRGLRHRLVDLLSQIPNADLHTLLVKKKLLLLFSDARMSCAFQQFKGREIILVFPDLHRLLLSAAFSQGQAILAHEFAHVILGHTGAAVESLRAQLEADRYAKDLGFGEDLSQVLESFPLSNEIIARLNAFR